MNGAEQDQDLIAEQLLAVTHSLQASHEVSSEMERSKCNLEQLIDYLPIIFAVITDAGDIFRGNHILSRLLGCSLEELYGRSMSELFETSTWEQFQANRMRLGDSTSRLEMLEFELPIDNATVVGDGQPAEHIFGIRPYGDVSGDFYRLYQITGQDVSQIREFERQLANQKP